MKLSRNWLNEEFVDLSHISDCEFIKVMNLLGHKVRSIRVLDANGVGTVYSQTHFCKADHRREHDDTVIEFDNDVGRGDCCSVIGLAREAAAAFQKPFKYHEPVVKGSDTVSIYELLDVDVYADHLCNRFTARMVNNIKIGPAPAWMRNRLLANDIQPINNIIDIVRYVMLEYGQSIGIIDYNCITDGRIVIREAEAGEVLTTANNTLYHLKSGMPVISDDDHIISLADMIGTQESEITDKTTTVLLVAANLVAANYDCNVLTKTDGNRESNTESDSVFGGATDPMLTLPALQRVCELIEMLDCGDVVDGIIDILNYVPQPKVIELDVIKINELLQLDITRDDMVVLLERLALSIQDDMVLVPPSRPDLKSISDIAREIARLHAAISGLEQ